MLFSDSAWLTELSRSSLTWLQDYVLVTVRPSRNFSLLRGFITGYRFKCVQHCLCSLQALWKVMPLPRVSVYSPLCLILIHLLRLHLWADAFPLSKPSCIPLVIPGVTIITLNLNSLSTCLSSSTTSEGYGLTCSLCPSCQMQCLYHCLYSININTQKSQKYARRSLYGKSVQGRQNF